MRNECRKSRRYTVSEVTARIKAVLETSLPVFWVEGEVSNFVHHSSGHMYFSLKDEKSQLPCRDVQDGQPRPGLRPRRTG